MSQFCIVRNPVMSIIVNGHWLDFMEDGTLRVRDIKDRAVAVFPKGEWLYAFEIIGNGMNLLGCGK